MPPRGFGNPSEDNFRHRSFFRKDEWHLMSSANGMHSWVVQ